LKTVADLIAEARKQGHVLTLEGDRVRCRPRLRGEIRRLAIENRVNLAKELRSEEDGELLPAPDDVVLGDGASSSTEQPVPVPKAKPAEWLPPRFPVDMSYVEHGGNGSLRDGRTGSSAFDRGDDMDEGRWD
jgi:hypothetical protein